ncbi:hypothetical protein ACM40_14405 [Chryseobacterium sp. BLS98]|uniref:hypothetical protein n=1 Tax=Chryseobacterium sp. BLS98 TaxID=885586 RepID=UPI00065AF47D|nr:hypothetical protein [Chryseobacterium sp. BLS98]KMQ60903.1 hypothetical protein ACM40_14405 [Chryseobacterium sp. BLS98]
MTKQIGNFSIEENEEEVSLHYSLSKKDWIDFAIKLVIAILPLSIGSLFLYGAIYKNTILELAIGIGFLLAGCVFSIDAASMIIRVRRNIVRILKKEEILIHRKTLFTSDTYKLQDIKAFIVSGKDEQVRFNRKSPRRLYGTLEIKLGNGVLKPILIVNPRKIFRTFDDISDKADLRNEAKDIVKELNRCIKAEYQVKDFIIENF